jgi:hypothetical protein
MRKQLLLTFNHLCLPIKNAAGFDSSHLGQFAGVVLFQNTS